MKYRLYTKIVIFKNIKQNSYSTMIKSNSLRKNSITLEQWNKINFLANPKNKHSISQIKNQNRWKTVCYEIYSHSSILKSKLHIKDQYTKTNHKYHTCKFFLTPIFPPFFSKNDNQERKHLKPLSRYV